MSKIFCISDKKVDYYVAIEVEGNNPLIETAREKAKQAIRRKEPDVEEFKEFEANTTKELKNKLDDYKSNNNTTLGK